MISSTPPSDQQKLYHLLTDDTRPHFIGRIAGIELKVAYSVLEKTSQLTQKDLSELENNAGIHTTSYKSLKDYCTQLIHSYEACSMIGEWPQQGDVYQVTGTGQQWVARRTQNIPKCSALSLEPYYIPPSELSWMYAVKGKRVLILHPFANTFQKQIQHIEKLYPNRSWFEGCSFQFLRPPLTLAGNHDKKDWREHMDNCIQQLRNQYQTQPFDIVLVGAGGYGMLLSHFIFREWNVSVVYVGGALQLFFGVIGKRWFTHKAIMDLVNDYWTRPIKEDQPPSYSKVERGCYW